MNFSKKISSNIVLIKGQGYFSDFRLNSLLERINGLGVDANSVDCRECFIISFKDKFKNVNARDIQRLKSVLNSANDQSISTENSFLITPRKGTFSPWSSKAQDIFNNCGISCIERIERGLFYTLVSKEPIPGSALESIGQDLADRMTESVIVDLEKISSFFSEQEKLSFKTIPILTEGKEALKEANEILGLALNDDEIQYLYSNCLDRNLNLTDTELMMFAQANSEHCRHKTFNARWKVDGSEQPLSLFEMIKNTHKINKRGVLSAYKDNAAVIEGSEGRRFFPDPKTNTYKGFKESIHFVTKVETHNHPTAISPFSGASTGSGGEIRDEGATGRGAKPKAGLCGFSVSNLRIPGFIESWESPERSPDRIAKPLQIMLEAPIGAAAFNNEFGRPNILGYFRSFEMEADFEGEKKVYGYHKPIMLAGGLGNIRHSHINKAKVSVGSKIIVLGGPSMLIGLGGGSASSLSSGSSDKDLDYASVQRENAEMERRCQEVLDKCWQKGNLNPILFIHDVGAGGLSNAIPELLNDIGFGAKVELRKIPNAEPGMSPLEIWCNESQERYVMAIKDERINEFESFCRRERCPYSIVGEVTKDFRLKVFDSEFDNYPIDIPLDLIFGKILEKSKTFNTKRKPSKSLQLENLDLNKLACKVLRHPSVASKNFLITIADRSITGLIHRDQLVGPWQVPVSDNAITLSGFYGNQGEAMSLGEKSPCAVLNSSAAARMAVAESITNIISAGVENISDIKLSANWMGSPDRLNGNQDLFEAVSAIGMDLCPKWKITIPVGKDSLSMATDWKDERGSHSVISPLSLVISAFSKIRDVDLSITPQLKRDEGSTELLFIDLAKGQERTGGSIASQVEGKFYGKIPDVECVKEMPEFVKCFNKLLLRKKVLAYHDKSDGGLFTTLVEMAFAGRVGIDIDLSDICNSDKKMLGTLFNEELGVVIQIKKKDKKEVLRLLRSSGLSKHIHCIGQLVTEKKVSIKRNNNVLFENSLTDLLKEWNLVSYKLQSIRDNPKTAKQEYIHDSDQGSKGLNPQLTFSVPKKIRKNLKKPKLAILREQGVNGHVEMAAAFTQVGFSCVDVHMTDLISGHSKLNEFRGLVACGGFSYGDVLGAGQGWASTILYNERLKKDFKEFFSRKDVFSLGICNGCQMFAHLQSLIPGSKGWPTFIRNTSEKFEARVVQTRINETPSIFFKGMTGSVLPISVAHGEGRVSLLEKEASLLIDRKLVPAIYSDDKGKGTKEYPFNPNGSSEAIAGVTNESGTVTIMMPHPERSFLSIQNSWRPSNWSQYSPWIKFFLNARDFIS
tara:strand:+ start:6745 stop:10665 length:3921 start_codon:yes stop_codon:yes gene_type:complete